MQSSLSLFLLKLAEFGVLWCTSQCYRAVKTIIAESCDAAGQAKAMGYMTSAMGVGSIAGPSIAGLLTRPCRHFASSLSVCEEGSLLQERY